MKVFKMPTQAEMLEKQDEFFSKMFMMSYSGLNKLVYSPKLFYLHYILGQKDDTIDKNMIEGKLVHCLFLNPDDFDKEFVLMATDLPSDNPKEVLHRLFEHYNELKAMGDPRFLLEHFEHAILDILKDMNLYQSLKTDAQRIEKIINDKHKSYWEYLQNCEGKIKIDQAMYDNAKDVVEVIKNSPHVMQIMGYTKVNINDEVEMMNEIELAAFPEDYPFGLRGFIDNLVFDHTNKVIRVNDLKKTSKDLNSFEDSIEYYRYWMQASIYNTLVKNVYLNNPKYKDYTFEFRFIVIDPYMQVAPIKISDTTLEVWNTDTYKKLAEAKYHFENKNFDLPYAFLINNELEI
jgi:hypothetical protein